LQALISAFNNDPHLASVPSTLIPKTLYVSTGCDFDGISFTGKEGFLLFIRLVGCAYYKKHKSAFIPTYPMPMSLLKSQESPQLATFTVDLRKNLE
jgi:hypothetical protein